MQARERRPVQDLLGTDSDRAGSGGVEVRDLSYFRVVLLPAGHPLAARADLRLEELAIEPLPRWSGIDPLLATHYAGRDGCRGGALPAPRFGEPVDDLPALLRLVELGRCVAFLPRSVADRYTRDGVVQRDVEGLEPTRLHVAWPSNGRSPATAAFIRAAIDVAAQRATTAPGALAT